MLIPTLSRTEPPFIALALNLDATFSAQKHRLGRPNSLPARIITKAPRCVHPPTKHRSTMGAWHIFQSRYPLRLTWVVRSITLPRAPSLNDSMAISGRAKGGPTSFAPWPPRPSFRHAHRPIAMNATSAFTGLCAATRALSGSTDDAGPTGFAISALTKPSKQRPTLPALFRREIPRLMLLPRSTRTSCQPPPFVVQLYSARLRTPLTRPPLASSCKSK